ncbi:uncharacterized protein K460DRAFT_280504 [Cucurbitaria berberidis CBS 394.84]|uniref:magnesium chelatase n=1 Tax=Cucurbitaria berberidis CBS 394.84 TaxID=1168544 RepID=A0A9P4GIM3_9PLEO|nr:uncharacterized protein K460DRAFT_280504 [Cucurbitaria berberidis CBS 394.84]KAF1846868.1 hypothetical protein K460DRAFT_280504 [Cucurbitaria berberidis CBS 394.84]
MEEANDRLAEKVQALSDIELAVLVCLVAEQHCIIEAGKESINDVQAELKLVASNVFGLTCAVLDCDENTTLDDFGSGILVKDDGEDYFGKNNGRLQGEFSSKSGSPRMPDRRISKSPRPFSPLDSRRIANIVVAKDVNQASLQVQIQALELIRGKRNFTRTAVHAAPKPFLFIALNSTGTPRLTMHLNDQFSISHHHLVNDGLPNLEDLQEQALASEDGASTSSVVHTPPYAPVRDKAQAIMLPPEDLTHLTTLMSQVKISPEVRAYLYNIVVFMRLHRAVAGGISAMATRHFDTIARALAPLHGLDYMSPSLVALAARKVYPHRIVITAPENERSMQWGSSLEAVKAVLEGVTVEDVIEEVLQSVEAPL